MVYNNGYLNGRISGLKDQPLPKPQKKNGLAEKSFNDVFEKTLEKANGIKFSKHAQQRMKLRNIEFSGSQMKKLEGALGKAQSKGVTDSLVLVDEIAMVVSIKNRTVVTVVGRNELDDNVFTNIDGAVIT